MDDPINRLAQIWTDAKRHPQLEHKSAICVSTVDVNGFPDGRFVDLKQVDQQGIVFCSSYCSEKGIALERNHKIALTAWWEPVGYQVRIQGIASRISDEQAALFWQTRSQTAKVISSQLAQSHPIESETALLQQFELAMTSRRNEALPRPAHWGGYRVAPQRIELLKFAESRLHLRENFIKLNGGWQCQILQP